MNKNEEMNKLRRPIPKPNLRELLLVSLPIIVIMIVSNPGKTAYVEWASWKFDSSIKERICHDNSLVGVSGDSCKSVVASQRSYAKDFVDSHTQQKNFVFLSVYTTKLPDVDYGSIKEVSSRSQIVGVFGNFIELGLAFLLIPVVAASIAILYVVYKMFK